MSTRAKAFFAAWVAQDLAPRVAAAATCPTPLAMVAALRASAQSAGISEEELRSGLGDLFEAVTDGIVSAMDTISIVDAGASESGPGGEASAATAMQTALSYLEGVRDVAGSDVETAADLVLHHLARQGFEVTRKDGTGTPRLVPLRVPATALATTS